VAGWSVEAGGDTWGKGSFRNRRDALFNSIAVGVGWATTGLTSTPITRRSNGRAKTGLKDSAGLRRGVVIGRDAEG